MPDGGSSLQYRENPKHKPGCFGEGPPRWFPSTDAICPDDISTADAVALLQESIEGRGASHPNARARYAMDGQGRFFKGYSEDNGHTWHGYPVAREKVPRQFPARVLRQFVKQGRLSSTDYKKLLGGAS